MTPFETPPLVWFQPGAEDEVALEWLNDAGWTTVHADCIVLYSERHNLSRGPVDLPWYRQVADEDGSQCSVWTAHNRRAPIDQDGWIRAPPTTEVEWVGDLVDLETSTASVPAYIRSLRTDGEALEACALRLSR